MKVLGQVKVIKRRMRAGDAIERAWKADGYVPEDVWREWDAAHVSYLQLPLSDQERRTAERMHAAFLASRGEARLQ